MTVALGTNIANPISTALSQWLGFDTMGKLANYGKLGAAADPDAVITALFANSEQGAFYDPSDLTTMFQDRAGNTPVTADGQTVGLILDKSKGLVLGSELVTNGDFSNGTTGWTLGAGVTISGGAAVFNNVTALDDSLYQLALTPGLGYVYEVTFEITEYTAGSVRPWVGGVPVGPSARSSVGVFSLKTYHFQGNDNLVFKAATSGTTLKIDNVSVKVVAGNHAVAPNDSARPLYKTSGGLHWLQFDGVNNSLSAAGVGMTQPTTTTIGFLVDSGKVGQGALMDGVSGRQLVEYNRGSRYTFELFAGVDEVSGGATFANNTPSVATCIFNSTSSRIRINTVASSVINPGSNGFVDIVIGSFNSGAPYHEGRIYSMIVRGALSTTQEITDTETWVNGKTGAY